MPIYEYVCQKCGHAFEQLMFKSDDKPVCPQCQGREVKKQMSACAGHGLAGGGCSGSCSACAGCGH